MKYRQPVSMPSSVSTWLNEQLEARGIDSEVYSRYILSLLHANSLDILHPEEDDFLEHKKEGRRTVVPHRRFRRASIASTLWWRHARYDADQIKRSAAVKCLKSAADQNCEIESLVNELCEKLKEVDSASETDTFQDLETSKKPSKISKKELAEKYYAAFPPLCPEENIDVDSGCQTSKFENSVWLSLQKRVSQKTDLKSPEKKVATITPKKGQAFNNFKKRHSKSIKGNKTNMEAYRTNNKNNFQHHNGGYKNYTKEQKEQLKKLEMEMIDNFNSWQFLNNFNLEDRDQCLDPANAALPDEMDDIDMYDSLPVNLSNLLDDSNDDHVRMMNSANTQQSGKQHNFIPYGTNFVSSIWSNEDNSGPKSNVELALDYEFGPVSVDLKQKNSWPDFNSNEPSNFLDQNGFNNNNNNNNQSVFSVFHSLPIENNEKDENVDAFLTEDNEFLFDRSTISLMKINHNKETSGFVIVEPHSQQFPRPFNLFGAYPKLTIPPKPSMGKKEDLMTSESTHFVPIKDTIRADSEGAYQDGASFLIGDILEKVPYKRSQSGSLCLEQEFGQIKKYQEYPHTHETEWGGPLLTDDFNNLNSTLTGLLQGPTFVPKFCIEQNNVACQTDAPSLPAKTSKLSNVKDNDKVAEENDDITAEFERDRCNCAEEKECKCENELKKDGRHKKERRSSIAEEVAWPKDEAKFCDKCNNNDEIWTMDWLQVSHPTWKYMENPEVIWSGREVCQSCLRLNEVSKTPQSDQHMKLKEDIFQDGEQLLSDINSLQKNFVDMSRPFELVALEPLTDKRKRRHSYIDNATNEKWGFQSRFHDDYGILRTWTVPSLRSVTL